ARGAAGRSGTAPARSGRSSRSPATTRSRSSGAECGASDERAEYTERAAAAQVPCAAASGAVELMPIRKRKPTSAGRRFQTVSDFAEVTRGKPERSLTSPKPKSGGRNSYGRTTSRARGARHIQKYRVVDFRREKDGVPARVASVEYDPNRNARIALLHYLDGEKRYILAPTGIAVGDMIQSGHGSEIRPGNAMPLRYIPVGT